MPEGPRRTIAAVGPVAVLVGVVVLIAGATNGLAGFGFAVVGTAALAWSSRRRPSRTNASGEASCWGCSPWSGPD